MSARRLAAALLLAGCGPLTAPMPVRLQAQEQSWFDLGWERTITPVDRADHQALLDTVLTTQAWELGVDRIDYRSEKVCSQAIVVMDVHFDRFKPQDDSFTVSLLSYARVPLRTERYSRAEIERSQAELGSELEALQKLDDASGLSADAKARLATLTARRHSVAEAFRPGPPPPNDVRELPRFSDDAGHR